MAGDGAQQRHLGRPIRGRRFTGCSYSRQRATAAALHGASFVQHCVLNQPRSSSKRAYWGATTAAPVNDFLRSQGCRYEVVEDEDKLVARVANASGG
jgi:hypothetical protein